MSPIAGQVGIVTGGGKGLGRAFAVHLAASGARVVVNNRNRQVDADGLGPADHIAAEIRAAGGEAVAEHSDVLADGAAQRMVAAALDTYGRLDFLVANAGVSGPAIFHRTTPEDWESVVATNLFGASRVTMLAARHMRDVGSGRIVLVASTAGLHGEATVSAYAASKGAMIALGRTLATELGGKGVHTNVLLPYATTPMTETGMSPDHRDRMTASSVAPVVAAMVDPAGQLNGRTVVCGGGAVRLATSVEWGTVTLPAGPLTPEGLLDLLDRSAAGPAHNYGNADAAFADFAAEGTG